MNSNEKQTGGDSNRNKDATAPPGRSFVAHPLHWVEGILLIVLIIVAVATTNELMGRKQLEGRITAKYDELAKAYFRAVSQGAVPSTNTDVKTVSELQDAIDKLTANGSPNDGDSQSAIRQKLNSVDSFSASTGQTNGSSQIAKTERSYNSWLPAGADNQSLLAALIIASGALGAMIAGLRSATPSSLRQFSLGVATGFICYLGLLGIKPLLSHGPFEDSSPPACAIFALLAGLFSDLAFLFLSRCFNKLLMKLDKVLKE